MRMFKHSVAILCGSFLMAVGINYFIIPHHLFNGGFIGLSLIAKYTLGFKPGLTLIILSLPIYIYAWFKFRIYFYNGMHGLLVSGFLIDLFYPLSAWNRLSLLESSIWGGIIVGAGISMMLSVKASTGGGDLLALMIAHHSMLNVGIIILFMDIIVILIGGISMKDSAIFYSFIMVLIIGITTFSLTHYLFKNKNVYE